MSLEKYNSKRNFKKTHEPKGTKKASSGILRFVVQKHAATRLHYDFRLEINGVLVSWAVPKGPSANPEDKRLAIQTEDHPMAYIDFEGIIPQGQYGGGTVIVWDHGTYHAEGNEDVSKDNLLMKKQLTEGAIKIVLNGEKLKGVWHMVLMKGDEEARQWLLMKSKDQFADAQNKFDEKSVLSGKTLDEVAKLKDKTLPTESTQKEAKKKLKELKNFSMFLSSRNLKEDSMRKILKRPKK